ncbi:expressed unknown protein [Seminavis robusta]|uniref:Uncharacterized protein n=1 Tax=Seminavis robusta TaxID=568900 RepID=A0A9N8EPX4_9STRA|nr:expressed unknown protein [Seminavis robusta]|eukprot:Sro1734_g294280.1 n/a (373) ;mRNA; f:2819-3937
MQFKLISFLLALPVVCAIEVPIKLREYLRGGASKSRALNEADLTTSEKVQLELLRCVNACHVVTGDICSNNPFFATDSKLVRKCNKKLLNQGVKLCFKYLERSVRRDDLVEGKTFRAMKSSAVKDDANPIYTGADLSAHYETCEVTWTPAPAFNTPIDATTDVYEVFDVDLDIAFDEGVDESSSDDSSDSNSDSSSDSTDFVALPKPDLSFWENVQLEYVKCDYSCRLLIDYMEQNHAQLNPTITPAKNIANLRGKYQHRCGGVCNRMVSKKKLKTEMPDWKTVDLMKEYKLMKRELMKKKQHQNAVELRHIDTVSDLSAYYEDGEITCSPAASTPAEEPLEVFEIIDEDEDEEDALDTGVDGSSGSGEDAV